MFCYLVGIDFCLQSSSSFNSLRRQPLVPLACHPNSELLPLMVMMMRSTFHDVQFTQLLLVWTSSVWIRTNNGSHSLVLQGQAGDWHAENNVWSEIEAVYLDFFINYSGQFKMLCNIYKLYASFNVGWSKSTWPKS